MKKELIASLFQKFEEACHNLDGGLECWSGRDFQEILGYSDWRIFTNAVQKAANACENAGEKESDQFVGITKMIENRMQPFMSLNFFEKRFIYDLNQKL